MNAINDGGPAFSWNFKSGMALRDYFAAKAMQSLIAKMPLFDRQGEHGIAAPSIEEIHGIRQDIAQSAFDYADAMIAARDVQPKGDKN